jgi:hypothetical protein
MRFPSTGGYALCAIVTLATPVQADELDRARMAEIAGSERLRMFAYGKLLETGSAPRWTAVGMKRDMVRQAFYADPGTDRVIATEAWAAPVLSYDGNINGGVVNETFTFNGLTFEADPASRAKAGLVFGVSGGGMARLAISNAKYVEARLQGEAVWSPEHRIGRSIAQLGLCSRNHVTGWTFLDLCHTAWSIDRELGSSTTHKTDVALTHLFQSAASYHELTATVSEARYDIGRQPSVTLSWTALWDVAATSVSVTHAAPIAGETALSSRIDADVLWQMGGRPVKVGLWHQRADGGTFLGSARADRATGISVAFQVRPRVTVQVAYLVNSSTVDFFDHRSLSLSARFGAMQW